MLNRSVMIAGILAFSFAIGLAAQAQRSSTTTESQTPAMQTQTTERKVHLEGCVYPKRALSTAAPLIVPQGSHEDYILTTLKVISASPGVTVPEGKIFRVEQVEQETLRGFLGTRVGVTARVEEKPDMAELQVIGIREIVGGCPATPPSHT